MTMKDRMLDVQADTNQLKGAYDHLATKADLELLKSQLLLARFAAAVLRFWQKEN